jgi:bifunctional non-homologous end joining protein LigD
MTISFCTLAIHAFYRERARLLTGSLKDADKTPHRSRRPGFDDLESGEGVLPRKRVYQRRGHLILFRNCRGDSAAFAKSPATLKRFPEGITGEHFYEKNAPVHTPPWVKRFSVLRSEGGSDIRYVLCNDQATLVWVTNLADIEKHALLAVSPDLQRPTSLVFDLDPGEPAGILECGRVALHLKDLLENLNLQSFVKVSGSKGLHLVVPLNCDVTYEMTQPFAKALAELASQQMPDCVVSEMAKTLRQGKVFIDWSQNSDFKTTVCVYAMRAKSAEPFISMPISWKELSRAVKGGDQRSLSFTPAAAIKRIKRIEAPPI